MGSIVIPALKLQKLDARFAGFQHFQYRIKFHHTTKYAKFIEIRNWCWETWGPSYERDILIEMAYQDESFVRPWSWNIASNRTRKFSEPFIYLATDKELSIFNLKWG